MALSDRSTDGEDDSAPYPLDYDVPDGVDERAGKLLATAWGVADVLEITANAAEAGRDEAVTQEAVDKLEAAHRAGQRVLDAPEYEAFLQEGPDALDDDLRTDVSESLAPMAGPLFGIELDWPNRDVYGAVSLDDLTTVAGWRGS
jgi:hypothetical protein